MQQDCETSSCPASPFDLKWTCRLQHATVFSTAPCDDPTQQRNSFELCLQLLGVYVQWCPGEPRGMVWTSHGSFQTPCRAEARADCRRQHRCGMLMGTKVDGKNFERDWHHSHGDWSLCNGTRHGGCWRWRPLGDDRHCQEWERLRREQRSQSWSAIRLRMRWI